MARFWFVGYLVGMLGAMGIGALLGDDGPVVVILCILLSATLGFVVVRLSALLGPVAGSRLLLLVWLAAPGGSDISDIEIAAVAVAVMVLLGLATASGVAAASWTSRREGHA